MTDAAPAPPSGTCRKIASGSTALSIHARGVRLLVVRGVSMCRNTWQQQLSSNHGLQATSQYSLDRYCIGYFYPLAAIDYPRLPVISYSLIR